MSEPLHDLDCPRLVVDMLDADDDGDREPEPFVDPVLLLILCADGTSRLTLPPVAPHAQPLGPSGVSRLLRLVADVVDARAYRLTSDNPLDPDPTREDPTP